MANAYTVLVVDDEPPIRRFLRTSLTAAGYRVASADDAAGAFAGLTSEKPDVIILDLGLPDRSGLEVIAEIRRRSPVPIIVLSARDDERSKVEALDRGADDYISKPFGMPELTARLRAALRHAFQADHLMLGKDAVQRGAGFRVNSLVQVNAAYFGAGVWLINVLRPAPPRSSSRGTVSSNLSFSSGEMVWGRRRKWRHRRCSQLMECADAPAERLEQVPRRPGPR